MHHFNVRCAISLLPIMMGITQPLTLAVHGRGPCSCCVHCGALRTAVGSVDGTRRWHSRDCRKCGTACITSHCGTDVGTAIGLVMQLLTSGLGTNDDPQPPATPLAVSPTTRLADGLNFDLLNRRRLALHLCWQNRWWTHWRWKIGFQISPRYIKLQRIAQACRRNLHCACVAPTAHIAGRPPQSFRWVKAKHSHHRRVWEDARHTLTA